MKHLSLSFKDSCSKDCFCLEEDVKHDSGLQDMVIEYNQLN